MEELGIGGFMGVQDVKAGMKISVALKEGKVECIGEVVECVDKDIFVSLEDRDKDILDSKKDVCQLRIVVENVLYCWDDIIICHTKQSEKGAYKLIVESNPRVFNRRKYPRMPLPNACDIKVKGADKVYSGRMVNISANGFAFACKDVLFESIKGEDVVLDVKNFDVLEGKALEGCVIRSSNNDGEYIVGCRMPEDSDVIKAYVSKNYSE